MVHCIPMSNTPSRAPVMAAWLGLPEHVRNSVVAPEHRHDVGCGMEQFASYQALKSAVLAYYETRAQEQAVAKMQKAVAKSGRLEHYSTTVDTLFHVLTPAYAPNDAEMLRMIRAALPQALKSVPAFMFQPSTSDAWDPSQWRDYLKCMVQADRTLRHSLQAGGTLTSGGFGGSAGPSSGSGTRKPGSAVVDGSQHPSGSAVHHQGGGHQGSVSRKRKGAAAQGTSGKRVAQASVAPAVPLHNAAPRLAVPIAERKCYACGLLGHMARDCPTK
jgi:hypothetical protein